MRQRLPDKHIDCCVVENIAIVIDDAVLAVGCVRVERNVGHYDEVGQLCLDRLHGPLYQAVRVGTLRTVERLAVSPNHREQGHGGYAQIPGFGKSGEQLVDTES